MVSSYLQIAANAGRVAAGVGATVSGAAATTFATQSLVHVATAVYRWANNFRLDEGKKVKDIWQPAEKIKKDAPLHERAFHYSIRGATRLSCQDKGIIALGLFGVYLALSSVSANPTGLVGKVVSYLPVLANKANPLLSYIPKI